MTDQLTDEQRDQLLRSVARVNASFADLAAALLPAVEVAVARFRQVQQALQAAGFLDEDGQPVHIGKGENAEDCPACRGTNPDYPFLCPGPEQLVHELVYDSMWTDDSNSYAACTCGYEAEGEPHSNSAETAIEIHIDDQSKETPDA